MEFAKLVFDHWFVTILILLFGVTPALGAFGGIIGAFVRKAKEK